MPDQSLPPGRRIKTRPEILSLQQRGKKLFSKHFLVIVRRNREGDSRLAITITKKVSKQAVGRNRLKRRLRDIFRRTRERLTENLDVLVIARKGACERDYHQVKNEVLGSLSKRGFCR